MNPFVRFLNRLRFRSRMRGNQSGNVVDGMVKARMLYKELAAKAHPDRNPDRREEAENLMRRITASRFDYAALVALRKEVLEKLG